MTGKLNNWIIYFISL